MYSDWQRLSVHNALPSGRGVYSLGGAQPEAKVREFVAGLLPTEEQSEVDALIAACDEASLRKVLEVEPGHETAVVALAELLVAAGGDEAVEEDPRLPVRIPESAETPRLPAPPRAGESAAGGTPIQAALHGLLGPVQHDEHVSPRSKALSVRHGPQMPPPP